MTYLEHGTLTDERLSARDAATVIFALSLALWTAIGELVAAVS